MMALFTKVKEGIGRGVATVSVKSGGSLGATVLKSQIDALERRKRSAVEELGDTVYTLFLGGAPDEETVRKRCLAVVSLDGRRLEKEEELRQIRLRSGGSASEGPASDVPEASGKATDEDGEYRADGDQEMKDVEESCAEGIVHPACDPQLPRAEDPGREEEASAQGSPAEYLPPIDTAFDVGKGSRTRKIPLPEERDRQTHSRRWVWPALAAAVLLVGGAGAYLFHTGLFYDGRAPTGPMAIERELNRRLSAEGLGVTTVIMRDGTALVTGSVRSSEEKEIALSIVKSHGYVSEVSDAIAATEDVRTFRDRLSFVIQSMLALKKAIAADYAVNKRFLKTTDALAIGSTYGIFVPETYAAFSIEDDGGIKTTVRNIGAEVNDKTLELRPSPGLRVWHWVSGIDERYLPFRLGDEIMEATLAPSTPAPPKPIANKTKPQRRPKPVVQARSQPVPHPSPRPLALPRSPVSVDSARLEGEINRSLRNAGIGGVTAEIRNDMGAVLKGTTVSTTEKQKAFDIAKGFNGVRDIRDIVFVIEQ